MPEDFQIKRREPATVILDEDEIRIIESHHAEDFEMESQCWPFHKICWVAIGKGQLEHGDEVEPIGKNDLIFLPEGVEHRFIDDTREPLTLMILCITKEVLETSANESRASLWRNMVRKVRPCKPHKAKTGFHQSELRELFRSALREQRSAQDGWQVGLASLLDRIVISLSRGFCVRSERHAATSISAIKGAIEFMDLHPYQDLQISEMASRCGLSARRFTDLFKQEAGCTYSTYLNQSRIRYACDRLDETGHILYACHESGFNDLAYFYRVFKKYTGKTPGDYLSSRA